MKKRTNICIQAIHKLPTDMATRLDIFGVYIQSKKNPNIITNSYIYKILIEKNTIKINYMDDRREDQSIIIIRLVEDMVV